MRRGGPKPSTKTNLGQLHAQLHALLREVEPRFSQQKPLGGAGSVGSGSSATTLQLQGVAASPGSVAAASAARSGPACVQAQPAEPGGGTQPLRSTLLASGAREHTSRPSAVLKRSKEPGSRCCVSTGTRKGWFSRLDSLGRHLQVASSRHGSRPVSVCVSRIHTAVQHRRSQRRQRGAANLAQMAASLAAAGVGAGLLGTSIEIKRGSSRAVGGNGVACSKGGAMQLGPGAPGGPLAAAGVGGMAMPRPVQPERSRSDQAPLAPSGAMRSKQPAVPPLQVAKPVRGSPSGLSAAPSVAAASPGASLPSVSPSSASASAAAESRRGLAGMAVVGGSIAQPRSSGHVGEHHRAARSTPFEPPSTHTGATPAAGMAIAARPPSQQQRARATATPARQAPEDHGPHPARSSPFRLSRPSTGAAGMQAGQQTGQQGSPAPPPQPRQQGPSQQASPLGRGLGPALARVPDAAGLAPVVQRKLCLPPAASHPPQAAAAGKGQGRQQLQAHKARTSPFRPSRPSTAASREAPSPPAQQLLLQQERRPASPLQLAQAQAQTPSRRAIPSRPSTSAATSPGGETRWHAPQQPSHLRPPPSPQAGLHSPSTPLSQSPAAAGPAGPPLPSARRGHQVARPAGGAFLCSASQASVPPHVGAVGTQADDSEPLAASCAHDKPRHRLPAGAAGVPAVGLSQQESSWLTECSRGGNEEAQTQAEEGGDAEGELGSWLQVARMARLPLPARLLRVCLPGGLQQDLFYLLLRQSQYVGSKVQQSHERKMKRLQRRLSALERRWRVHPVHSRISRGALQAIKSDLEAAATGPSPPSAAATPHRPTAAAAGLGAPRRPSTVAAPPAAAAAPLVAARTPPRTAAARLGSLPVAADSPSPTDLSLDGGLQAAASAAASRRPSRGIVAGLPAGDAFDFCFAGLRRQALRSSAGAAQSPNLDGAATPTWSAAGAGGCAPPSGPTLRPVAAAGAGSEDGHAPTSPVTGLRSGTRPLLQAPERALTGMLAASPGSAAASPTPAAATAGLAAGAAGAAAGAALLGVDAALPVPSFPRPSTSMALSPQPPGGGAPRPATANAALQRLKSSRAAALRPATGASAGREPRLRGEPSVDGPAGSSKGLGAHSSSGASGTWVAGKGDATGAAALRPPGALLWPVAGAAAAGGGAGGEAAGCSAPVVLATRSEPQLSYWECPESAAWGAGDGARPVTPRTVGGYPGMGLRGAATADAELPSALERLKTARHVGTAGSPQVRRCSGEGGGAHGPALNDDKGGGVGGPPRFDIQAAAGRGVAGVQ